MNKTCKVVFVNCITGECHDKVFYGRECADAAVNFIALHPEFKLVSTELVEND